MSKPLLVGITGGIGTGKSTVCRIFTALGVPVYDADTRAKQIMTDSPEVVRSVKALFGEDSYQGEKLNRPHIAQQTFSDQSKLDQLNRIVHPAVGKDFGNWVAENQDSPYLIKEAALLFEAGSYQQLDTNILVTSPLELRKQRIKARDPQRSEEQIDQIIDKQWPDEKKRPLAQEFIVNDEMKMLIPQVLALHSEYLQGH